MKIVSHGMAITLAALSLAGSALAAPLENVLYSFTGGTDGAYPYGGLIADKEGALYSTTLYGGGGGNSNCAQYSSAGCGTVFKLTPPAKGQTNWTETVLYTFCSLSNCNDGAAPHAGLIADKEGALYGTTGSGGSGCPYITSGCGTVFKLTPPAKGQSNWTETVLYSFSGSDGAYPGAGLIADEGGALYGTTSGGGTGNFIVNAGTVFKLTPPAKGQSKWTETLLYSFCSLSNCSDGWRPAAGLIADEQGVLYGTTALGGTGVGVGGSSCPSGCGTVFKLAPTKGQTVWTPTVLYRFSGSDGASPQAGLIADKEGALYSTTALGGSSCPQNPNGCGTVFKLTPPAKGQTVWTPTVLYSFTGGSDGVGPSAGLIADKEGALYSTTYNGGGSCPQNTYGCGTVFKLTPPAKGQSNWTETVLYRFSGSDGATPGAGLIADKEGALYSTTEGGGAGNFNAGTVFKIP